MTNNQKLFAGSTWFMALVAVILTCCFFVFLWQFNDPNNFDSSVYPQQDRVMLTSNVLSLEKEPQTPEAKVTTMPETPGQSDFMKGISERYDLLDLDGGIKMRRVRQAQGLLPSHQDLVTIAYVAQFVDPVGKIKFRVDYKELTLPLRSLPRFYASAVTHMAEGDRSLFYVPKISAIELAQFLGSVDMELNDTLVLGLDLKKIHYD